MTVVTTPWCPRNECVQYPPSTSQTRIFLSAPAVASNPPEASQAMSATGPLCACRISSSSFNPKFKKNPRYNQENIRQPPKVKQFSAPRLNPILALGHNMIRRNKHLATIFQMPLITLMPNLFCFKYKSLFKYILANKNPIFQNFHTYFKQINRGRISVNVFK
jgi:hypothetical protein